ncbi:hypothetical protein NQ317_008007 [Molorchus minor]|uniref:CCHC-type domain-containing protein n=1 Tax=Molorchus minor TaxID=1323400 RepID=A0ABQ9J785_9CUCU|nr:hypothetical protein NQ317_008007 [Molorchus minor]
MVMVVLMQLSHVVVVVEEVVVVIVVDKVALSGDWGRLGSRSIEKNSSHFDFDTAKDLSESTGFSKVSTEHGNVEVVRPGCPHLLLQELNRWASGGGTLPEVLPVKGPQASFRHYKRLFSRVPIGLERHSEGAWVTFEDFKHDFLDFGQRNVNILRWMVFRVYNVFTIQTLFVHAWDDYVLKETVKLARHAVLKAERGIECFPAWRVSVCLTLQVCSTIYESKQKNVPVKLQCWSLCPGRKHSGPVEPDSQVISTNNSSEFNKKSKSKRDLQYSGRRKLPQRADRLQKLVIMTDTQLNVLIPKKIIFKGNLTRFSKFLDKIKNSEPNKKQLVELELRMSKLESTLLNEFTQVQLDIDNFAEIPEASADSEADSEADSQELTNFESAYFSVLANAKDILNSQSCLLNNNSNLNSPSTSNQSPPSQNAIKHPRCQVANYRIAKIIKLPYEKWLEFRDLYVSLIHNCERPAAQCIKYLEFSATNYDVAWGILCERFENKELMVHNHIKALFNLREVKSDSPSAFRDLIDTISKNLKALDSLKVSIKGWDPLIIYLVLSKLDTETHRLWEQQRNVSSALPTLEELKEFLANQADFLEKVNLHKNKSKLRESHKVFVTSSDTSSNSDIKFSCYICKQPHSIYKCTQFLSFPVEKGKKKIESLKMCQNCLKKGHQADKCKFGHCKYCKEKHNSLLHINLQPNKSETSLESQEVTSNRTVTHCNYTSTGQVLLSTAVLQVEDVHGNGHSCKALLDSASMSEFHFSTICKQTRFASK